jgi:hypothetical protein
VKVVLLTGLDEMGALMEKDRLKNNKRKFFRVAVDRLNCVIKNSGGEYEVVEKSIKPLNASIELKDVSTGGLRIESAKEQFKKGTSCEIVLPKLKDLDGKKLKCEVTRASFIDATWVHDIGLRFVPPNTDYLKQFVETIKRYDIK